MNQRITLFNVSIYSLILLCIVSTTSVFSDVLSDDNALVKRTIKKIAPSIIGGWNHIGQFPQEFEPLSRPSDDYNITQMARKKRGVDSIEISTVLVKKLIDTKRQHSNGIKLIFTEKTITIGQLDKLTFDLKINPEHIKLPVLGNIVNTYRLNSHQAQEVKALFDDNIYLNVTLFGVSADDQNIKSIFASKIIHVPSIIEPDDFFSVQINSNDFKYYWQQQWQESLATKQEVNSQKIEGFIITAESNNGKTLRHYLPEGLPRSFEEIFIEIPLVVKNPSIFIVK
jgi:hypothetical protein